jgi:exopolyphosphatase/guanosine-5'-triphosphate,3'-diphosphate pyrophosphatase
LGKRKNVKKQEKNATMSFVIKSARTYDPDPTHSEQVTTLALAIFDGLRSLHEYGPVERRLLEIAGRLHDVGWSRAVSGKHHKLSRDLILELDIPGLDKQDRLLCALIARYHTKTMPDASRHRRFALLDSDRRTLVEWLAGILRVADGLDCSHARAIRGLTSDVRGKAIVIRLEAPGGCQVEVEGARKKQDLLERKTGKRIDYQC